MSLTAKQARFVEEYLIDLNATQAAIRAGYSQKTAHVQGPRLLENVRVASAIATEKQKRSERVGVTQEMVIDRLWVEATKEGEGASHAARVSALSWLGKHFGAFTDKVEHSGHVDTGVLVVPERGEAWEETAKNAQGNRLAVLAGGNGNGKRGNGKGA